MVAYGKLVVMRSSGPWRYDCSCIWYIWFQVNFDLTYSRVQKSWDTFASLEHFPIHTGPTPPLTAQTMLDAYIQNFFRVSTLYRVGEGRTARNFWKGCTVLRGNREWQKNMNIALLSRGLLSRIVGWYSIFFISQSDLIFMKS